MSDIRATNKNLYQSIQQKKEGNVTVKPPLGVKPCYIQADERIKDLSDAISRYAGTGNYQTIRTWAKEILIEREIRLFTKRICEITTYIGAQMEKLDCIVQIYTDSNSERTAFVMPADLQIGDTPYDWTAKFHIPIKAVNPDELYNEITKAVNGRDKNLPDENFKLKPTTPLHFCGEAFIKDEILYNGLVSSIESALRESTIVWDEWEYKNTAKKIADRIIGRE